MWFLLLIGLNKHLFEVLTKRGNFVFAVSYRKKQIMVMSISNMSFKKTCRVSRNGNVSKITQLINCTVVFLAWLDCW